MKRTCIRCKFEGKLLDSNMKMSPIIHEWLCSKCTDLMKESFYKFREDFINVDIK